MVAGAGVTGVVPVGCAYSLQLSIAMANTDKKDVVRMIKNQFEIRKMG